MHLSTISLLLLLAVTIPSTTVVQAQVLYCCYSPEGNVLASGRTPTSCSGGTSEVCEFNCCLGPDGYQLDRDPTRNHLPRDRCINHWNGFLFGPCGNETPLDIPRPTLSYTCCFDEVGNELDRGSEATMNNACIPFIGGSSVGPCGDVDGNEYCCEAAGEIIYRTPHSGDGNNCRTQFGPGASFGICPGSTTNDPGPGGNDPGMLEDPHIKSFHGEWFDYMGECDLKLMHVPKFDGHNDLTVHVRTTLRYQYSFIETAVLLVGKDKLEVSSWGQYSVNGVDDAIMANSKATTKPACLRTREGGAAVIIADLGGYPVVHAEVSRKKHIFEIVLGKDENITISNMKDIVSVTVHHPTIEHFGNVEGLLGDYSGHMLGRDGVTDLRSDMNAMGQEWQVRDDEPMLFGTVRAPQYPSKCQLPQEDMEQRESRRLGQGITKEAAKIACSHLKDNSHAFEACVYDVTATNDLDQAQSGVY